MTLGQSLSMEVANLVDYLLAGAVLPSDGYHPGESDITYATPISFIFECLQEYGFEANLDLA